MCMIVLSKELAGARSSKFSVAERNSFLGKAVGKFRVLLKD